MDLSSKGFSFAEILVVVAIMGIITSVALKNLGKTDDRVNFESSLAELQALKIAIVGDENALQNGERVIFGFVGDIGGLPATLDALVSRGSLGLSTLDTLKLIAYGWNGPYVDAPFSSDAAGFKTDGWGNEYVYSTVPFSTAPGDTVVAKISSLGADGAVGGTGYDADIFVEIPKDMVKTSVTGSIKDVAGNPVLAATARVYEPDGFGALTSRSASTDASGNYSIQGVSQGVRAVTVQLSSGEESEGYRATLGRSFVTVRSINDIATIILVGIATATGPGGRNLNFNIQSKIGEDVSIVDFKAVYTPFDGVTGPRYEQKSAGGAAVWSAAATLGGSGDKLSDLSTYASWALNDNGTENIGLTKFQDNTGANLGVGGSEFTTTFFTSAGDVFTVGPFTVGGAPTFVLVGDASGKKGSLTFDVKNNTGGNETITDMKLVYIPYDASTTGPEFDEVQINNATDWSAGGSNTVGSDVQLSTIAAFSSRFWTDGSTNTIEILGIIDLTTGRTINPDDSVFTLTLYTLSASEYEVGPFIAL